MAGKSKRTTAPAPPEFPWPTAQPVQPPTVQPVRPPTVQSAPPQIAHHVPLIPSMFAPGSWLPACPQQSMSAQAPCWTPSAGIGGSAHHTAVNLEDYDLQKWGMDSHPPGGFLSFFKNIPSPPQVVSNGTSPQPIYVGDDSQSMS